jgi:hypothetical protein
MKKAFALVFVLFFSVSMAKSGTIGIDWRHSGYLADENQSWDSTDDYYSLLIWSASSPSGTANLYSMSYGLLAGEYLLSGPVESDFGYFDSTGTLVLSDSDVGGADINNGYIFARVFNPAGTYYWQSTALSPIHIAYDSQSTGTVIDGNLLTGNTDYTDIQAAPEPGTMALFGLGLATLAFKSRKRRKLSL